MRQPDRRRTIGVLFVAALAAAAAGCTSFFHLGKPEPGPFLRLTGTQSGELVTLTEGRRLAIDLPERRGYNWVVAEEPSPNVLKRANYRPQTETWVGVPMQIVYFFAEGTGITSLKIEQLPAHGGGPPADVFLLTVEVAQ